MKLTYAVIRQIHLFAGLILAVAVLFYTVSGMTFIYARWLPRQSAATTSETVALPADAKASDAALRSFVAQQVGSTGRTNGPQSAPAGAFRQRWSWPTGRIDAEVSPARDTLTVVRTQFGLLGTLRNFHVLRGSHGGIGYVAWWFLLDVVALSMIVFAVTGFLLWYRSTRDRRLGWVFFGTSWIYTLGLVAYLIFS